MEASPRVLGDGRRYPTECMLTNPYQPPKTTLSSLGAEAPLPAYRMLSLSLLVIALIVAIRQLPPFFSRPVSSWQPNGWLFGFMPAVYFLFAAVCSLLTEFTTNRVRASRLLIVLLPLVGITGLIVIATAGYVWEEGFGFLNDWRPLAVCAICPVIWLYFTLSIRRWRLFTLSPSATHNLG